MYSTCVIVFSCQLYILFFTVYVNPDCVKALTLWLQENAFISKHEEKHALQSDSAQTQHTQTTYLEDAPHISN